MYYLFGKINRGHGIWPLFGGCPLLGESVIRGFTVLMGVMSRSRVATRKKSCAL